MACRAPPRPPPASKLGQGTYGSVVMRVSPTHGGPVAVKTFTRMFASPEFVCEAGALASMHAMVGGTAEDVAPWLPRTHALDTQFGCPQTITTEVCGNIIHDAPASASLEISKQLVRAVCEMNVCFGIRHRDLSPANILWDKDRKRLSVIDWGTARGASEIARGAAAAPDAPDAPDAATAATNSRERVGCIMIEPPEIIAGRTASGKEDIWALGRILQMIWVSGFNWVYNTEDVLDIYVQKFGVESFEWCRDDLNIAAAIQRSSVAVSGRPLKRRRVVSDLPDTFPADGCPPELCELIGRCLQVDPELRISSQDLFDHPWASEWCRRTKIVDARSWQSQQQSVDDRPDCSMPMPDLPTPGPKRITARMVLATFAPPDLIGRGVLDTVDRIRKTWNVRMAGGSSSAIRTTSEVSRPSYPSHPTWYSDIVMFISPFLIARQLFDQGAPNVLTAFNALDKILNVRSLIPNAWQIFWDIHMRVLDLTIDVLF